jgi:hypothetical protein
MTTALITGWAERVGEVAAAFEDAGFTVMPVTDHEKVAEVCASLPPGSVDCYVQLPGRIATRGDTVVERVRNFLTDGLIRRFEAAAAIAPTLASDACVLLVSGNHPAESGAPDDQRARLSLLRVLAHSLLVERGGTRMRVTIVDHRRSAADLVTLAQSPGDRPIRLMAELKEIDPDLDYDDWRNEVMALTATDT